MAAQGLTCIGGEHMRIRAIHAMTGMTEEALEREHKILKHYARPDTEFEIVSTPAGAQSIEGRLDEYVGAVGTLRLVKEAWEKGFDGVIITCFGNACLEPARELVPIPVVGSGLASMLLAAAIGQKFSIIGTVAEARFRHEIEAYKAGVHAKFVSERPLNMRVLDLHKDYRATLNAVTEAARRCVEIDGADVVVLGCFGLIGLAEEASRIVGAPVIDPAGAVVHLVETLVNMGIAQSKISSPPPRPKKRDFF